MTLAVVPKLAFGLFGRLLIGLNLARMTSEGLHPLPRQILAILPSSPSPSHRDIDEGRRPSEWQFASQWSVTPRHRRRS
jgi:hypothetical protein